MLPHLRGGLCALLALVAASWPTGAALAHPLRVDDILSMQAFSSASLDPSGRWLVLEVEVPYLKAASFEGYWNSATSRSRVMLVDLKRPSPPRLAFPQPPGGYIPGAFSPSGRRLVVFRERHYRREVGVLTLATGQVRWLGVAADMDVFGLTTAWRSDHELLVLALGAHDRPFQDRGLLAGTLDIPTLWSRSVEGKGETDVVNGSGRFVDVHPRLEDRRLLDVDVTSGRSKLLLAGDYDALSLSPRGDRLALVTGGARLQPEPGDLLKAGFPVRRRALEVLDLASGRVFTPAPSAPVTPGTLRWSDQGQLLFAAGSREPPRRDIVLYRLPADSRQAAPVALGALALAGPGIHADWMGEDPIVFALAENGAAGRSDWYRIGALEPVRLTGDFHRPPPTIEALSSAALLALDEDGLRRTDPMGRSALVLAGRDLGSVHPIDSYYSPPAEIDEPARVKNAVIVSEAGGRLDVVPLSGKPSSEVFAPIGAAALRPTVAAAGPGGALRVTLEPSGSTSIAWTATGGRTIPLLRLNARLDAVDWSAPIAIDNPGPKGEPFKDWLYLPPYARPGERFPLVVVGYPSATWLTPSRPSRPGTESIDDNPQLIAAQGFAVLVPSLPRLGADFTDGMTPLVLAAVDRASRMPGVDAARVGFWGHSGGALLGFKLATETRRFSAIVAADGGSDLISDRGQSRPAFRIGPDWDFGARYQIGWSELGQGGLHSTPYTDLQHYIRASPIFAADRIATPILIVHGDQDPIPYAQSEEMFSALYRLKKDALFMTFLGEEHCFGSPPNIRRYFSAGIDFLRRELSALP